MLYEHHLYESNNLRAYFSLFSLKFHAFFTVTKLHISQYCVWVFVYTLELCFSNVGSEFSEQRTANCTHSALVRSANKQTIESAWDVWILTQWGWSRASDTNYLTLQEGFCRPGFARKCVFSMLGDVVCKGVLRPPTAPTFVCGVDDARVRNPASDTSQKKCSLFATGHGE